MLSNLRPVCGWLRPGVVNHSLTDEPVVRELRRAADSEALVAVYDDGTASAATPSLLQRELGVSLPPDRELRLPTVPRQSFGRVRRTVRAVSLPDADPPVVLLSRRSLEAWDDATRDFVLAHEFGHLRAGARVADQIRSSLTPAPARSGLAIRALADARDEYRAGVAHAELLADLPATYRSSVETMAEYHAAERASGATPVLDPEERAALAIRNAAKYLPLEYDPGVGDEVRTALAGPLPRYVEWISEGGATSERSLAGP